MLLIRDKDDLFGWMIINFDIDGQDESELHINETIHFLSKDLEKDNISWLDLDDPIERKYSEIWGDALRSEKTLNYCTMEAHFAYKLHYTTMEALFMFISATNNVVSNPDLLSKFGLPEWALPLIRGCWTDIWQAYDYIYTRIEIGFHGRIAKVVKMCGNTTKGLLEAAVLQDKYAAYHGLDFGQSPSHEISSNMLIQCAKAITGFVHIYVDSSQDDELRALYLQKLISKIGTKAN